MFLHSTFFIVILMSFTRAKSMKVSVIVGSRGLHVIEKGHLFTWNTKSLEPSFEVWWSGVFIVGAGLVGLIGEIFFFL